MTLEEQRLLIVAPTGRDSSLLCEILQNYRITCQACVNVQEACALSNDGVGALILAEESLDAPALDRLADLFGSQPAWSDIPVLLLTSNGERIHAGGQALLTQRGVRATFSSWSGQHGG